VHDEAITEGDAFTGGNFQISAVLSFDPSKSCWPNGLAAKQTVVAHVPPSRVTGFFWIVEHRNADGLAIDRT